MGQAGAGDHDGQVRGRHITATEIDCGRCVPLIPQARLGVEDVEQIGEEQIREFVHSVLPERGHHHRQVARVDPSSSLNSGRVTGGG
jgi:hypothetical protein